MNDGEKPFTLSLQALILEELKSIRKLLADAHNPATLIERDSFAAMLSIGTSTFDRLRATGKIGPAEVRIGGGIRWHRAEVEAWLSYCGPNGELHDSENWPAIWADLQRRATRSK